MTGISSNLPNLPTAAILYLLLVVGLQGSEMFKQLHSLLAPLRRFPVLGGAEIAV